jgi:hypothetical protein
LGRNPRQTLNPSENFNPTENLVTIMKIKTSKWIPFGCALLALSLGVPDSKGQPSVTPPQTPPNLQPGSPPAVNPGTPPGGGGEISRIAPAEAITRLESSTSAPAETQRQRFSNQVLDSPIRGTMATPLRLDPQDEGNPSLAASSVQEEEAEAREGLMQGRFYADLFHGWSRFKEGSGRPAADKTFRVYGTNLSYVTGTRKTSFYAGVPIMRYEHADLSAHVYGLNLGLSRVLAEGLKSGVSLSGLYNDVRGEPSQRTGSAGIYSSYSRFAMKNRLLWSVGAMLELAGGEGFRRETISTVGISAGYALTHDWTITPYVVYVHNHSLDNGADPDYWDLGADLTFRLGNTWQAVIGVKTTVGDRELKRSWMVSLGSEFRF